VGRLSRAGRRTNLALLLLLAVALTTGTLAFGVGTPVPAWLVTTAHGLAGLGLVLLIPWKSVVVRRGFRRRPPRPGRLSGVALAILVPLALVAGFLHSLGGFRAYLGVFPMQVHVAAALIAVPFAVHHVLVRRQLPRRGDVSRRSALRSLALAAGAVGAYAAVEGIAALARLPGRGRQVTGSHEVGSGVPLRMPVTQWLADPVPELDPNVWTLRVVTPIGAHELGYAEFAAGTDVVTAVLDCTGGWYAQQRWRGVRLDRILPVLNGPQSIDVVSVTGYRRRFPAGDAAGMLLAAFAGDAPLSAGHGAPLRLVAPGRRGFWWVKWVTRVEVVDQPWWWQPPAPLQ
jgi:DMSO/TMAO reductase YedYZ molybdopterin-dependent catalytic subunit